MIENYSKYRNEYNKRNYERVNITFKIGMREQIELHYKEKGYKSLNEYVNKLIADDMNK